MSDITDEINTVVFVLNKVPTMDITGLVALESTINRLTKSGKKVCLVGCQKQPKELIAKSIPQVKTKEVGIYDTLSEVPS
ncbi:MAG: STAS domain-containing protein [Bdellovibrionales bacterium]